jgi:glycosyltransferase involved in cell wall biosynthesis
MFTKDGMPFVRDAVASLQAQTRDDFEIVVQDAVSTDGTAEFFRELGDARVKMVSEPDDGLGDAYNRAFPRCRGDIIGTLDSDNLLLPNALADVEALFRRHRTAVAIYGAVSMIDEAGKEVRIFTPAAFDQAALMRCELVPPFSTTFFNRRRVGADLRGDETLRTGQDFELLLRLSARQIIRTTTVLGATRLSYKSMTRSPENYELFTSEKILALERFIAARPHLRPQRDEAVAGIYCWAAESILELEGPGPRFDSFLARAAALTPDHERLVLVRERASAEAEREPPSVGRRLTSS